MTKPKNTSGQRILVIDDEADIRKLLEVSLVNQGHSVLAVSNGEEGIKKAKEQLPDLILLDMVMPFMDGSEVCRSLQKNPVTRKIPIIFLTAKEAMESKLKGFQSGAVDYITKPFEMAELTARITSQLKIQSLYREIENYVAQINLDLDLARQVQKSILPHSIPHVQGVNIAATYFASEKVGGDYYDIIKLNNNELALLTTDVSGHGIAAAFITAMAKMSFRNGLRKNGPLTDLLDEINTDFNEIIQTDHFLTAFVCKYNCTTRVLNYAKAGHITQLLFTKQGEEIIDLRTEGFILGSFEEGKFEEKQVTLQDGDKLVLFTDGLVECKSPKNEEYGIPRLKSKILEHYSLDPGVLVDLIMEDQQQFIGKRTRIDDFTLVILEVNQNSFMEKVKSVCKFQTEEEINVLHLGSFSQIKEGVESIITPMESKGFSFEFLRQARMSLAASLNSICKAVQKNTEKARIIWQIDGEKLKFALFSTSGTSLNKLEAFTAIDSGSSPSNSPLHSLLSTIFDDVQVHENGRILLLIKRHR